MEMEFKHRCRQLQAVGWDGWGLAKLFAQEWEGDITVVMPATIMQVNSTATCVQACMRAG